MRSSPLDFEIVELVMNAIEFIPVHIASIILIYVTSGVLSARMSTVFNGDSSYPDLVDADVKTGSEA